MTRTVTKILTDSDDCVEIGVYADHGNKKILSYTLTINSLNEGEVSTRIDNLVKEIEELEENISELRSEILELQHEIMLIEMDIDENSDEIKKQAELVSLLTKGAKWCVVDPDSNREKFFTTRAEAIDFARRQNC